MFEVQTSTLYISDSLGIALFPGLNGLHCGRVARQPKDAEAVCSSSGPASSAGRRSLPSSMRNELWYTCGLRTIGLKGCSGSFQAGCGATSGTPMACEATFSVKTTAIRKPKDGLSRESPKAGGLAHLLVGIHSCRDGDVCRRHAAPTPRLTRHVLPRSWHHRLCC